MPHGSGDEPSMSVVSQTRAEVCPTGVGMNRLITTKLADLESMPHGSGDEPVKVPQVVDNIKRMPHGSGDEPMKSTRLGGMSRVCPTGVGMNRLI